MGNMPQKTEIALANLGNLIISRYYSETETKKGRETKKEREKYTMYESYVMQRNVLMNTDIYR